MWSIFMFNPYLSCTYINIYFIFSKEKEKGGVVYVPLYYSWQQLWQWPCNQFTSFQNCLSNHKERKKKCLLNELLTFQPVDVSSFFILSTFPNLCWHMLKQQKQTKKRHKVEFWWIFSIFFEALFSQDKTKLFSQYNKKKFYLYWASKYTENFIFYFHLKSYISYKSLQITVFILWFSV